MRNFRLPGRTSIRRLGLPCRGEQGVRTPGDVSIAIEFGPVAIFLESIIQFERGH